MAPQFWEDQYRNHQLWTTVDALNSTLEAAAGRVQADERNNFDRIRFAASYFCELREPPVLIITSDILDAANNSANQVMSYVSNWINGSGSNHLAEAALNHLNPLLTYARSWPPSKDRYARGVLAASTKFVADAETRIAATTEWAEGLKDSISNEIESFKSEADRTHADSVTKYQENQAHLTALAAQIQNLEANIAAQTQRIDQVVVGYQTAFTDAESKRTEASQRGIAKSMEEFTAELTAAKESWDDALVASRQSAADALTKQTDEARQMLADIEEMKVQVTRLVEAVGNTGTATKYGEYASQERASANIWRRVAVSAFALSFVLFLATLITSHIDGHTPWQLIALRFGGSLALIAGGIYSARESTQHRQEERRAKTIQLDLAALDPFIANLPVEQKEQIKAAAATRLFTESPARDVSPASPAPAELPTPSPEVLKLASTLLDVLKK